MSIPPPPPPPSQLVFNGGSFSVAREGSGAIAALRIVGVYTPEVAVWISDGMQESGTHIALHLRELMGMNKDFVETLGEAAHQSRPLTPARPAARRSW